MSLITLIFGLVIVLISLPLITSLFSSFKSDKEKEKGIIGGFVDDILGTGKVKPHREAAKEGAGSTAANNLRSNLTLTPVPDDPLFGESGFFTNIGKFFSGESRTDDKQTQTVIQQKNTNSQRNKKRRFSK